MQTRTPEIGSSSDGITMHHDKKVGLGLGILLVGIVSAFFFREEPHVREPLPELQTAEMLDRKISESLVDNQQPHGGLEEYELRFKPAVDLQGIEIAGLDETDAGLPSAAKKVFDEEFDFLNEPAQAISGQPKASETPVESGLANRQSGSRDPQTPSSTKRTEPPRDLTVSKSSPPKELPLETEMFAEDLPAAKKTSAQPFPEDHRLTENDGNRRAAGPAETETPQPQPEPRIYTVQQGDTLTRISSQLLGEQIYFRKIFELNRDQLTSPDDLRPGMRLRIPAREKLNPPTELSLSEPRDPAGADSPQKSPERSRPLRSRQDRRVIIPKRVRLNEPVAKNPRTNRSQAPRATIRLTNPQEESNDKLPTLEGLEPLDLPR